MLRKQTWLVLAGIAGLVAIGYFLVLELTSVPAALLSAPPGSTRYFDRNGLLLRDVAIGNAYRSQPCRLEDLSPAIISATLSAEDKRFFSHHGIDMLAGLRAVWQWAETGEVVSGASTITQQLIKITSPGPRSPWQKLREIWLAHRLETLWTKNRILEQYLNRLDYGNLRTGIQAASHFYFDKPPSDLTPAESALLAALPNAPSRLNPHRHLDAAMSRQRWVLAKMHRNGYLDKRTYQRALGESLTFSPPNQTFAAPHFVDLIARPEEARKHLGKKPATTLDLPLQRWIEGCLAASLRNLEDRSATSGAVVVIENAGGEVRALVGSPDYFDENGGQVNAAWAARSPGSALKPFTFLLAMENGYEASSIIADVPTEFPTAAGPYRPHNYNHRFYGPVSLRFALANSLNVATIRLLNRLGGAEKLRQLLHQVGLTTLEKPGSHYGLGLTLGNAEARLLEVTNAYAALARLGVYKPYLLNGETDTAEAGVRIASIESSWLIADILSDNTARVPAFGWQSALHFDFPVACKTGTSTDFRDNWVFAYTPEFTVGVWVGNLDGSPMQDVSGVTGAGPIMHQIMTHLHSRYGTTWYQQPGEISRYVIDPLTGHSISPTKEGAIMEVRRKPPAPATEGDYDALGRVWLGPEYRQWVNGPHNHLGDLVVSCEQNSNLKITQPRPGTVYLLDPDLSAETQWIELESNSNRPIEWAFNDSSSSTGKRILLSPGTHQVTATDIESGQKAVSWFTVQEL